MNQFTNVRTTRTVAFRLLLLAVAALCALAARPAQAQTIISDGTYAGATLTTGSYQTTVAATFNNQVGGPGLTVDGATLTIDGGQFTGNSGGGLDVLSGVVNINSGTFNSGLLTADLNIEGGTVNIAGGQFLGSLTPIVVGAGATLNLYGVFATVGGVVTGVLEDGSALPIISNVLGGVVNYISVPLVTSASPSTIYADSGYDIEVKGLGMSINDTATFNGIAVPITSATPTDVVIAVPASVNVADETTQSITITVKGTAGLGTSTTITVLPTQPYLGSVNPKSVYAGEPAFQVQALGSKFDAGAVIEVNGTSLPTNDVSTTELFATVPASYIKNTGTLTITVLNSSGSASTTRTISVLTSPNPTLSLLRLSQYTVTHAKTFTLEVAGTSFDPTAAIVFNGVTLKTTYVSATHLTAVVTSTLDATPGSYPVSVTDDGVISNSLTLTVN